MQEKGLAASYGFRYDGDGLLNDHEALWKTMQEGGCALCNLRVGHIVTLIAAREQNGERLYLRGLHTHDRQLALCRRGAEL